MEYSRLSWATAKRRKEEENKNEEFKFNVSADISGLATRTHIHTWLVFDVDKEKRMNIAEEYFWKAKMAFQTNRWEDSYLFLCQAIEQLDRTPLTLEQVELIWSIIPSRFQTISHCEEGEMFRFRDHLHS